MLAFDAWMMLKGNTASVSILEHIPDSVLIVIVYPLLFISGVHGAQHQSVDGR